MNESKKSVPLQQVNPKIEELRRSMPTPVTPNESVISRALDNSMSEDQKIVRERVIETLQTIYDPELPVNLYDLGLIYDIAVDTDFNVKIQMTLTAPACPVAGTLPGQVERRIAEVPGVESSKVELVWSPPWDRSRMSESALLELGLL
jgi:FeS assembly SUF system protein